MELTKQQDAAVEEMAGKWGRATFERRPGTRVVTVLGLIEDVVMERRPTCTDGGEACIYCERGRREFTDACETCDGRGS